MISKFELTSIQVRSVYRIAEYAQGYDGYLRTTEAYFYALDSLPLFLAISIWVLVWPPRIVNSSAQPFADSRYGMTSSAQRPAAERSDSSSTTPKILQV